MTQSLTAAQRLGINIVLRTLFQFFVRPTGATPDRQTSQGGGVPLARLLLLTQLLGITAHTYLCTVCIILIKDQASKAHMPIHSN